MSSNNEWPFSPGEDEFLTKINNKPDITIEEIFEEEEILTNIRIKNESFGNFFSTKPELIMRMIRYCLNDFPEEEILSSKIMKYSFFSSEIFSYELEGLIELFFKPPPKTVKEESKCENDEVCFGEKSDIKEEDIDDENFLSDLKISPVKSNEKKEEIFENIHNENEEEKKLNEMIIGEKVNTSINMEEPTNMNMNMKMNMNMTQKKMPEKLHYNLENLYLLEFLFSYLEKKKIELLNPTSLGYFSKIINGLLNKKFDHMMFYIEKNPNIIENVCGYLTQSSISDFISRILRLDNPNLLDDYNKNIPLFMKLRIKLLEDLTKIFKESENLEEIHNIASILCEMMSKAKRINGSKIMLEEFNKSCLHHYFERINSVNSNIVSKAYSVIEAAMKHFLNKEMDMTPLNFVNCSKSIEMNCCMDVLNEEDQKPENINETNIPDLLIKFLPKIIAYLKEEQKNETDIISSTFGTKFAPFGAGKLQLISVLDLSYLIEQNSKLAALLSEDNIPEILMNFMTKYEWNNMLHQETHDLIKSIIESKNIEYKKCLFEKFDILTFIMKFMDMEDYVMPKSFLHFFSLSNFVESKHQRKLKRGYLGFLTKICNNIIKKSEEDAFIKQKIEQNPEFKNFVENVLKKVNSKNNDPLAGFDPRDNNLENSFEYVNEVEATMKINDPRNDFNNLECMPPTIRRDSSSKEKYKLSNLKPKDHPTNFFDDSDMKLD